jgi:hypothetical protein
MTYTTSPRPASSPWGKVQGAQETAPGVWIIDTARHGGVKLSAARNAAVPAGARNMGGFYEEDCEWAIPALVHPDAFNARALADAARTCKDWTPAAYTAITGQPVSLEESRTLRKQAEEAATCGQFVVGSAFGSWSPFVPVGKVGVYAKRASDGAEQWALVDAEAYASNRGCYVLDAARDEFISKPERTHS